MSKLLFGQEKFQKPTSFRKSAFEYISLFILHPLQREHLLPQRFCRSGKKVHFHL